MLKFLIFIIAIQINLFTSSNIKKIALLSIKLSIDIMSVFGIKLSSVSNPNQ